MDAEHFHDTQPHVARLGSFKPLLDACRACPLWRPATQGVAGEGPKTAELMIVGEQPGTEEDLAGRPFVGPAGRLLDQALGEAGLDRERTYVTNAVKHFKFEPRGKRRIHQRPNVGELRTCRWWLLEELRLVRPKLVLALGATAARGVLGKPAKIADIRGRILDDYNPATLVTVHPAFLLRLRDPETRARERRAFVEDLKTAARAIGDGSA